MKNLVLPPSSSPAESAKFSPTRRVVIIGANGAGKTRFTRCIAELSAPDAVILSTLSAIYTMSYADPENDYYDRLFIESAVSQAEKERPQSQLERLLALAINDELMSLLRSKLRAHSRQNTAGNTDLSDDTPESTILDSLIDIFHHIFPDNNILVESGNFLFERPGTDDRYPTMRLSDGERSVLYYAAAILYAPPQANIIIDSPEIFLHPTTIQALWNRLELLRPDCRFVYTTHDLDFASSRAGASLIWVHGWNPADNSYDYSLLEPGSDLGEDIYMAIMGARRNVLFVEGDGLHSIDARLYPLLFNRHTVKSVGSCNRVIEATRTFNALADFHHMRATGIVDRDRRADGEVDYLRRRHILVPDVAEIENIFMLEDIIATVARDLGRDPARVLAKVRRGVIGAFSHELREQALEHARHTMKKTVEYRVDGRFNSIGQLEQHIARLCIELNPRGVYNNFCQQFRRLVDKGDYEGILRVYNHKSMIAAANVPALCGLNSKDQYISHVLHLLSGNTPASDTIRKAAIRILRADDEAPDPQS